MVKFLRVVAFLALAASLSCGHFQAPDYTPQGEFATPDEYFSSREVKRPTRPVARGPFQLQWPVHKLVINRGFKASGRREHHGLDIKGRKGDAILAAHDGVVIYAGTGFRGYGKMILLEYDDTWATLYGHLNRLRVKTGDVVKAGHLLGDMGRTGRATGVHLHFEVLKNKLPTDPGPLMPQGATAD